MSERRYIDEHATPQNRARMQSHPGKHDPGIVASRILSETIASSLRNDRRDGSHSHEGELWRLSNGGRPNHWTDHMEAHLGEVMPRIAAGAADYLKRGDRNTSVHDGVGLQVSPERLAAQRLAAQQAEKAAGSAGAVVQENNLNSGVANDGLLARLQRLRGADAPSAVPEQAPASNGEPVKAAAGVGEAATAAVLFGGSDEKTAFISRGYHETATRALTPVSGHNTDVIRFGTDAPTRDLGQVSSFDQRFARFRTITVPPLHGETTVAFATNNSDESTAALALPPTGESTVALQLPQDHGESTTVIPSGAQTRPLSLDALQRQ